jgi:hypothetical protein
MEAAGLVVREEAPPPIATTLFRLTPRGRDLEAVIAALGRWGAPLLPARPGKDVFLDHWIALPLRLYVRDETPSMAPVTIALRAGEESLTVETVGDGSIRTQAGNAHIADLRIEGPPQTILQLLTGKTSVAHARAQGLRCEGDVRVLRRFGAKSASD